MSARRNATATKRRHGDNNNTSNSKMTAKVPPKSDWLSVFAAASLFIPDEVLEGSLFPMTNMTSTTGTSSTSSEITSATSSGSGSGSSRLPTARDFGPIIFHDLAKFYQHIGRLYAALQGEKDRNDRNDNNCEGDPTAANPLAAIRICTTDPNPFMDRFRKYGYAVVDGKYNPAAKRVYVRRTRFRVVPDADTVAVVSAALTSLGYKRCDKRRLRNGNGSKLTSTSTSTSTLTLTLTSISAQGPATSTTAGSGILPTKAKSKSKAKAKGVVNTTDWLDVFAAVAMYIDDCVMRGCLLAHGQQSGSGGGGSANGNAKFDRLIIYSRPRFYRAAHHLYSAIEREQMTGGDPALANIRIVCPVPENFEVQLGRFGYRRVDDGTSMGVMGTNGRTENEMETEEEEEEEEEQQQQQPEVYIRDPAFPAHIAPNSKRALIVYNVLERMDFTPKQEFGPPCQPKEGPRTCIPHPSPTTVADTGLSMTVDNGNDGSNATTTTDAITTTATMASKSILDLCPRRHSEASTGSTFVGKVAIDKNIVPTPIAHHAATTALRIATMSSAAKPPTDTLGMSWGYIPGTTDRTVHSAIPPPPLSFMRSNSQIKEGSVFEGPIAVTRPELITIDDDSQYPPLPGTTSTATGRPFVPWADMTEAEVSDGPKETGIMDIEDGLNISEWSKTVEEYHDRDNMSPIGAKEGVLVPDDEEGDDHLSVMSTTSPVISAIAEDDVSSCPSMNCDDQDEALIPFINY